MPVYNGFFIDHQKVVVKNKKLPFIHNPTLGTEGLLTRTPEEKNNHLELLPSDVLREVLKLLSAKELKALAATSTRFLREMMTSSTRSLGTKLFYPYLHEIFVGDFIHLLQNNKPMMYIFNRHFEKSVSNMPKDKAIEQALSRVMHLDKHIIDKSIRFYHRERLRGTLSELELDNNGHIATDRFGIPDVDLKRAFRKLVLVVIGAIICLSALAFPHIAVPLLLIGGAVLLIVVILNTLAPFLESILKTKDPLETIDNEHDEAPDVSEDDTAPDLGIDHEEESGAPEDGDEISAGRVMVI